MLLSLLLGPPDLEALRWKARPVVIFGSGPQVLRQRRILRDPGVRERQIVVMSGTPEIARRLGVKPKGFLFVLVGKDGGVKLQSSRIVERKRLFAIIDAMPMRRSEMREE